MLVLSSTTDKIEVVTSTAASIDYVFCYTKLNLATTPVVDDAQVVSGTIAAAATTSVSGFPGASTDRWAVVSQSYRNRDATLSCVLTVRHVKAAGTARELFSCTLLPGEELKMDKNGVWFHYDANGGVYGAVSTAMKRTVLTAGAAATYTTPPGCRAIDVEVRAGGGAGGGASSVATSGGGGGGGGEGGLTRKLISPPAASYTYTIGGGGAAGAAGANAGGNGSDTTFGALTAKGGSGGAGATSAAATRALGGAGGIAGSGGDTNDVGEPGIVGIASTAALVASGAGGGKGANGVIAQGAGVAAAANSGGGGSGGASISAGAAVAGGAGGSGQVVVTEFY